MLLVPWNFSSSYIFFVWILSLILIFRILIHCRTCCVCLWIFLQHDCHKEKCSISETLHELLKRQIKFDFRVSLKHKNLEDIFLDWNIWGGNKTYKRKGIEYLILQIPTWNDRYILCDFISLTNEHNSYCSLCLLRQQLGNQYRLHY